MSHLEEGTLHALLDGEVPSEELGSVERHLAACASCRAALDEARRFREDAFGLIESLDQQPVAALVVREPMLDWTPAGAPAPAAAPAGSARAVPLEARRRERRWVVPTALAATAVLAIGLGYTLGFRQAADAPGTAPAEALAVQEREALAPASEEGPPAAAPPLVQALPQPAADLALNQTAPAEKSEFRARDTTAPAKSAGPVGAASSQPITTTAGAEARTEQAAPPPPAAPSSVAALESARTARNLPERIDAVQFRKAADSAAGFAASPRPGRAAGLADRAESGDRYPTRGQSLGARLVRDTTTPRQVDGVGVSASSPARQVVAGTAIRILGGSIRLLDGMEPYRYEAAGAVVRVLYRTSYGLLALEQWREDNVLSWQLVVPAGAPVDSASAWEERVR
ncbi:MAG: zf-HC2 domain-containing protein [Gemmatimonadales bacterium]